MLLIGKPVPTFPQSTPGYYDDWELTNRPAMLPFLAEYTNRNTGEKSGGFAMPSMVTEPVNALVSLLNTPAGTMPNPQSPENQRNALTALLSLYGGNALGGMARGAAGRAAGHALEMEAARPVAYSNAIEGAMSNPSLLRLMDDINYAGLNRRALDEYGVGYEGLTSSQEAALRGWSDPAHLQLWSDTGKPNPVGSALVGRASDNSLAMDPLSRMARAKDMGFRDDVVYHGTANPDFDAFDLGFGGSRTGSRAGQQGISVAPSAAVANEFAGDAFGGVVDGSRVLPLRYRSSRQGRLRLDGTEKNNEVAATLLDAWDQGFDSVRLSNYTTPGGKTGQEVIVVRNPNQLRSVNAAFDPHKRNESGLLLSDVGKPSAIGSALAGQNDEPWPYIY